MAKRRRCEAKTRAGARCKALESGRTGYCALPAHQAQATGQTGHEKTRTRKRRPPKRDWDDAFIEALEHTQLVSHAAAAAGVGRSTVYDRRDHDAKFAARWDDIVERATEELELEAYRRAYVGTEKPIYQGGACVGTVREFSDTLTIFLLKARKPEKYRDRHLHEHRGDVDVNLNLLTDHDLREQAADLRRRLAAARSVKPSGLDAGD